VLDNFAWGVVRKEAPLTPHASVLDDFTMVVVRKDDPLTPT
jgi:hypothetical protein